MSNRLTNEWTETAEEAFGRTGKKGTVGEEFVCSVFHHNFGWEVLHLPSTKHIQCMGIDIAFRSPNWKNWYTADVKHNIQQGQFFYIEKHKGNKNGWLLKAQCDRIIHCSIKHKMLVWYDVKKMQEYCKNRRGLFRMYIEDVPSFVTVKRLG